MQTFGNFAFKLSCFQQARELRDDEIECLQAVKRRVDHLKEYDKSSLSKMEIWRRQRYERILVDFLFRTRCFETAQALAKATGIEVCPLTVR